MEAVILIGLQGSGKSTLYRARFFDSHLRLNRDMLGTAHKETILFHACLAAKQPFVVDNTNPLAAARRRYILAARAEGFAVVGYYFDIEVEVCLTRNAGRHGKARVPELAIRGTLAKMEQPSVEEGYDQLYRVTLDSAGAFTIHEWPA
jgi:predicted kinase